MVRRIEVSRSFKALNTTVKALINVLGNPKPDAEQALDKVQALFRDVEHRLSRFLEDSELSLLNRSSGKEFKASPLLYEVVQTAMDSAQLTKGIFDPTILPYLVSSGYDRSFEFLKQPPNTSHTDHNLPRHTWKDILMDPQAQSISLPEGCSLDLGGIAKGWAVDQASEYLAKFRNYAIDAGGDIVVKGTQTDGQAWTIGIADPLNNDNNLMMLSLPGGAICTSTTTKRQWISNGVRQHHIIDPRTGAPAGSGVISATVIARSAVLAETISKAALILGPRDGLQLIDSCGETKGMLVLKDGSWLKSKHFSEIEYRT